MHGRKKCSEILLIEDSKADIRLLEEVFRDTAGSDRLHVAGDGEDALDFLYRRGRFTDAPRPDMVLLDLNLPKIDGRTVLQTIKSDPDLKTIPVVVLSTSKNEEDISMVYSRHANAYVLKPINFRKFEEVVRNILRFWIETAVYPSDGRDG